MKHSVIIYEMKNTNSPAGCVLTMANPGIIQKSESTFSRAVVLK